MKVRRGSCSSADAWLSLQPVVRLHYLKRTIKVLGSSKIALCASSQNQQPINNLYTRLADSIFYHDITSVSVPFCFPASMIDILGTLMH